MRIIKKKNFFRKSINTIIIEKDASYSLMNNKWSAFLLIFRKNKK